VKLAPRLLLNPLAARGRARARIDALLRDERVELREVPSSAAMTAEARLAATEGLERVLVAGGDGALHHAIRGLAGTDCALGIVPAGTGNDLARALGVPSDPLDAGRLALRAAVRPIDLGRIDGLPFACVLGIGLDAEVNRCLSTFRRLPAKLAYAAATLRALASFVPQAIEITSDETSFHGPVVIAAFANTPWFGGGMRIAPAARLDDGALDLVVVRPLPLPTLVRLFPRVYSGRHLDHPAVHSARLSAARLHSPPSWIVHADGEAIGPCAAAGSTIDVWPRALLVAA
jgi:diacylglycerol kinase (ATP)